MLSTLRARLTYANVVATIALFVALGGSSYAAITITSRNVPRNALTGADIRGLTGRDVRNNSLTGRDVKRLTTRDVANGRLLAEDFAPGQLPAGPKGDKGEPATKLFARVAAQSAGTVLGPSRGVTGVTHPATVHTTSGSTGTCPGAHRSPAPDGRTRAAASSWIAPRWRAPGPPIGSTR